MRAMFFLAMMLCANNALAMGNYPEASTCAQDKPYYAVCTAGGHNLQGWIGKCQANREDAQREAEAHAQKSHVGVMQWTGVTRISRAAKYRNSGLPP